MKDNREMFEKHSNFQFLMPYVKWDGKTYIFKESNSLEDTKNYYNDYLHFIDCWSYWCASATREGYKLVPLQPSNAVIVAIENKVENQLEASGITQDPFRLDGETIYKAMIGASE